MKYSRLSLFLTLIIFSTQSHAIVLDQSAIDKKALEIEKKLTQERYLMYGLTTLAFAHELYQWVPVLKDCFYREAYTGHNQPSLSFFQSIKEGARYLFYTKEGWVSLIQSGFSIGGFVMISQIGERFIHPDTLRWYIQTHAPYQLTIKLMQDRINDLQNPSIDAEQNRINNEMLQVLFDRLVIQARLMCSYMAYKVKYLSPAERVLAERANNFMLRVHYKWLNDIERQLHLSHHDYAAIERLLALYQEAVGAQVNHFALVEGETRKERATVTQQMKQKLSDEN